MKAGWEVKTLGEVCKIARGGSPRPIKNFVTDDPEGINWIRISDTQKGGRFIDHTEQKIRQEGVSRSRFVTSGSFVLSNSMSFGRPYILRIDGCIHDGWLVLEPDYSTTDQDFLYHVLGSSFVFKQFDKLAAGSTVRNLNKELVSKVSIPLPPLAEQKRIVSILDEAFEGLDRARENAEANLKSARELFEETINSVFIAESSQSPLVPLEELALKITKGSSPKWQGVSYVDKPGVLFVTSENVGVNKMLFNKKKYVEDSFNEKDKKSVLSFGDVLTNIVGASIGRTAIYDRHDTANINQAVCLIRCNKDILDSLYLSYLLNSPYFKRKLHEGEVNTARANLSLTFFRKLKIPVPSLAHQTSLITEIGIVRAKAASLEATYQTKLQDISDLRQSLLQKAFAGELT